MKEILYPMKPERISQEDWDNITRDVQDGLTDKFPTENEKEDIKLSDLQTNQREALKTLEFANKDSGVVVVLEENLKEKQKTKTKKSE